MIFLQNMRALSIINYLGLVLFVFFFIFGMQTPVGSIAQILSLLLIFYGLLNVKQYFLKPPTAIFYFFIFLFFDFLICFIVPVALGTYDFSIIPTKLNFIVSMLATYVLARKLSLSDKFNDKDFFKLLLNVFMLQAVLVVCMLINSDFAQLVMNYTRSGDIGERLKDSYDGARGLGIADSAAFGFAISMGLLIFLVFFSYKNKFINLRLFVFLLAIGVVASISAGRTAILGIIFGFLYLAINFKNFRALFTLILSVVALLFSLLFLININQASIENETLSYFYSYSMEPILNYIYYGSFATGSTDILIDMYFPLTEHQIFIGDGRYMDGQAYYMSTDAGYMRYALFYGIFISSILYLFFILFLIKTLMKVHDRKYLIFIIFLAVLSFILHYKGEVILLAISYNKILFLILFFIYFKSFALKEKSMERLK